MPLRADQILERDLGTVAFDVAALERGLGRLGKVAFQLDVCLDPIA